MHLIWHTVLSGHFTHQFENTDTLFWVKGVSDLAYELCNCVDIEVNRNPKKPGHLELKKTTEHRHQNIYFKSLCVYCVGWIRIEFE